MHCVHLYSWILLAAVYAACNLQTYCNLLKSSSWLLFQLGPFVFWCEHLVTFQHVLYSDIFKRSHGDKRMNQKLIVLVAWYLLSVLTGNSCRIVPHLMFSLLSSRVQVIVWYTNKTTVERFMIYRDIHCWFWFSRLCRVPRLTIVWSENSKIQ